MTDRAREQRGNTAQLGHGVGVPRPVRLAVLGSPVAHSLSPRLHAAAYRALGLAHWIYTRADVPAGGLSAWLDELEGEWRGFSVTMPLKGEAFALAETVDERARLTGAVNTLIRAGDAWSGANTDVEGIVRAVEGKLSVPPAHAVITGAGATATSALVALRDLGAGGITVAARHPDRARPMTELAGRLGMECNTIPLGFLRDMKLRPGTLIVNTVPGNILEPGDLPASAPTLAALFDVTYAPWPTQLAAGWSDSSYPVVGGADMLLHQAVEQVRRFTGAPTNWRARQLVETAMRSALAADDPAGGRPWSD